MYEGWRVISGVSLCLFVGGEGVSVWVREGYCESISGRKEV